MSESEETKWRLGVQSEEAEERAAELSAEEDVEKEQLQQKVQTKAEELGSGGEGSLVTRPGGPIVETHPKGKQATKTKRQASRRELSSNIDMTKISRQLERQANQLARIEKVILPFQKSVNKIDRQSDTIKQLFTQILQIQRHIRKTKSQGKKPARGSKKRRSIKGRRS
jgi:hypothetical protein